MTVITFTYTEDAEVTTRDLVVVECGFREGEAGPHASPALAAAAAPGTAGAHPIPPPPRAAAPASLRLMTKLCISTSFSRDSGTAFQGAASCATAADTSACGWGR